MIASAYSYGTDLMTYTQKYQTDGLAVQAQVQSNAEVIRSATIVNAQILRQDGKLGELIPGAFADLLIVDGDPLKNLGIFKDEGPNLVAIPRLCENPAPPLLPSGSELDSTGPMIRPGFLDSVSRQELIDLARDGSAAHRLARRANALVLLDQGMSCEAIAAVLLLDDDTVRTWHRLYEEDGIEGLASFGYEGSACRLSDEQQDKLKAWIAEALPRTTREVGAWIEMECGIAYQGRSGLIALLHRLGMEHRKPKAVSRKLDPAKQAAFIRAYEDLLTHLADDEAVLFADAVHPTHAVRPGGAGFRRTRPSPGADQRAATTERSRRP